MKGSATEMTTFCVRVTIMFLLCCCTSGRRYDKDGRERMWWTEEAVQAFKDRSQCFVEQYSNYEMFGIPVSSLAPNSSFDPARCSI